MSTDVLAGEDSAVTGGETMLDMSVPRAGVEEVSRDGFSCMNQQSVPLLHLAIREISHTDGGGGTQMPCCSIGKGLVKLPLYGDDCEAH